MRLFNRRNKFAFRMFPHDFRNMDTPKEEFNARKYYLEIPTKFTSINNEQLGMFERKLYEYLS